MLLALRAVGRLAQPLVTIERATDPEDAKNTQPTPALDDDGTGAAVNKVESAAADDGSSQPRIPDAYLPADAAAREAAPEPTVVLMERSLLSRHAHDAACLLAATVAGAGAKANAASSGNATGPSSSDSTTVTARTATSKGASGVPSASAAAVVSHLFANEAAAALKSLAIHVDAHVVAAAVRLYRIALN
jgi:hypothetical protein